jgi:hypothetical protein
VRPGPGADYTEDPYGYRPAHRRRSGLGMIVTVAVGLGLAGAAAIHYGGFGPQSGVTLNPNGGPPLIEADPAPTKSRPDNPGGLVVPNQDKQVYERLQNAKIPPTVERLLPPPEEPLPRPLVTPPVPPLVTVIPPVVATVPAPAPAQPAPQPAPAAEPVPVQPPPAPAANAVPPAPAPVPAKPAPAAPPLSLPKDLFQMAAKQPDPGPAAAPPASGGWRVQLASVRTEADAKAEWKRLTQKFPADLGGMAFLMAKVDLGADKGVFYRVQGAAADEAQARAACAHLQSQSVGCVVVRP